MKHPCQRCGVEIETDDLCQQCVIDSYTDDDEDCGQCDGSGYWYHCIDGCCINDEEGCEMCARRCDFCNPRAPAQQQEAAELRKVLGDALAKQKT